jgi:hypothetical protein
MAETEPEQPASFPCIFLNKTKKRKGEIMTYLEAIVLGLVQGLAEFLPISSSGHLALLQQFFGIREDNVLLFAVLLHVGTLISVFIVYWKDIWELIVELGLTIKDLCTGKGLRLDERDEHADVVVEYKIGIAETFKENKTARKLFSEAIENKKAYVSDLNEKSSL